MQKRNLLLRILLLIVLYLSIIIPVSYARYITNNNGDGNLNVAKWNIILNDKNIDEEINLDLFKIANDSNLKDGTRIIAPGVGGNITLNIKNASDVVAECNIDLEELSNSNNIPIVYSLVENGEYVEINNFEIMNNEIIMPKSSKDVVIYWKWDFYKNHSQNQSDSNLGSDGTALFEVGINIKMNQKVS